MFKTPISRRQFIRNAACLTTAAGPLAAIPFGNADAATAEVKRAALPLGIIDDLMNPEEHHSRDGRLRTKLFMNSGWSGNSDATELAKTLIDQGVFGQDLARQINDAVSRHLRLNSSAEVLPDRENRVELADMMDTAGVPKPRITFRMDD